MSDGVVIECGSTVLSQRNGFGVLTIDTRLSAMAPIAPLCDCPVRVAQGAINRIQPRVTFHECDPSALPAGWSGMYSLQEDCIRVPRFDWFFSQAHYAVTLLHEGIHASAHSCKAANWTVENGAK